MVKSYILNAGGTLGMVGKPLRPAKSAEELIKGIVIPSEIDMQLEDFELRQDSTNTFHAERVQMTQQIAAAYDRFDFCTVFHGTDSLEETAAAFCMIWKLSLQKPVFVIGCQLTKDEAGSDVPMQISNSQRVGKAFVKHGIVGVFTISISDVLDGSRVRKKNESNPFAFHTPGRHPIANCFPRILLNGPFRHFDGVLDVQGLRMDTQFERHVVTLKVSADAPPYVLMDQAEKGRLKGAILECKGAGNIPDKIWDAEVCPYSWIDAIKVCTNAGIHIGVVSPFDDGRVILERYELGQKAKDAGAISLESLTPGMADVKFRQAIALHPKSHDKIQQYISTDILGELLTGIEDETD